MIQWHLKSPSLVFFHGHLSLWHLTLLYGLISLFPEVRFSLGLFALSQQPTPLPADEESEPEKRSHSLFKVTRLVNARVGIRAQISVTQAPEILATKPCYLPNFDVT